MRVLVLGGTGWAGRAIVRELLDAGADVTCLARGGSGNAPAGARLVRADRRAEGAYAAVRGEWDEVIELSYERALVEPALTALADSAAHWTLVSTVSVYARNDEPDTDESAALVEPVDLAEYADAKVQAERSTAEKLGDRLLIARPGLIVGPGDPSDRFGYWPARFSRGGPVLVPTVESRFVQVIDVGDLAAWMSRAAHTGTTGAVNVVGDPLPMRDFFGCVAEATGWDADLVEVEDDALLVRGVEYWAGPRSLPLWLPASETGFARRSARRFGESGGGSRPMMQTIADVLADERSRGIERSRRSGLTRSEEARVLDSIP